VESNLYLGNIIDATSQDKLTKHAITHILPVGSSNHPLYNSAVKKMKDVIYYPKYINITDFQTENILEHLPDAVRFIDESIANGGNILVHCAAGVSRSATVVIAYLMWKNKWERSKAEQFVRSHRHIICPNYGFKEQLVMFEKWGYEVDVNSEDYNTFIKKIKTGNTEYPISSIFSAY